MSGRVALFFVLCPLFFPPSFLILPSSPLASPEHKQREAMRPDDLPRLVAEGVQRRHEVAAPQPCRLLLADARYLVRDRQPLAVTQGQVIILRRVHGQRRRAAGELEPADHALVTLLLGPDRLHAPGEEHRRRRERPFEPRRPCVGLVEVDGVRVLDHLAPESGHRLVYGVWGRPRRALPTDEGALFVGELWHVGLSRLSRLSACPVCPLVAVRA